LFLVNALSTPVLAQSASTASQADSPRKSLRPFSINLRQFEIPFSIDAAGVRPIEVQLYVSRNQGANWELFATQPASGKNFLFTTQHDGIYWFATRTVDASGKSDPVGTIQPQQIVNIDTENPLVEIKANLTAEGKISVSLACTDQSPSVDLLRIDYSIDQSRQWNAVNDVSGRTDPVDPNRFYATAEFTPLDSWQQISVRALVGDAAGNKTIVTTTVDKPRVASTDFRLAATKSPSSSDAPTTQPPVTAVTVPPADSMPENVPQVVAVESPLPADSPRVAQLPAASPPPTYGAYPATVPPASFPPAALVQPGQTVPPVQMPTYPSVAPQGPMQLTSPNPTIDPATQPSWAVPQFAVSSGVAPAMQPAPAPQNSPAGGPELAAPLPPGETALPEPAAATPTPQPRPKTAAAAMRPLGEGDSLPAEPRQSAARVSPNAESPNETMQPGFSPSPNAAAIDNRVGEPIGDGLAGSGVQIRYSNSRKFSLEYEIESAGLAGVSDVELWGSRDRGLTWKRWGSDPDRESPFDIETNNDGAYGFRIVVVASNGLATPRPIENDLPDIFVVVDTEAPAIRITGAAYGEGNQTGALVMRYQCTDVNLTQRPITLSFGPTLSGPWSTIAAGLENEGAYVWPADPNLPRQIYIRIDALDLAGNIGTYILDTPIDIQGLAPRARIRGFNPLTGSAGGTRPVAANANESKGSDRPQTANQPQARFK
jgi:hypothetical protein